MKINLLIILSIFSLVSCNSADSTKDKSPSSDISKSYSTYTLAEDVSEYQILNRKMIDYTMPGFWATYPIKSTEEARKVKKDIEEIMKNEIKDDEINDYIGKHFNGPYKKGSKLIKTMFTGK